jgi:hypothetical protein
MEWCSAQGFEYIECSLADSQLDAQLRLDGDPQGIARVTAALEAHMWPGHIRKQSPERLQPSTAVSAAADAQTGSAGQQQPVAKAGPRPGQAIEDEETEETNEESMEKLEVLMLEMAGE